MKITQQELIEFADENDLQIFGNSTVIISKIRAIQRLVNKGLIPKPIREGSAPSYWENDTDIKDRIIWLDEQKKKGKSYKQMKEELEPTKTYSQEEAIVEDMLITIERMLDVYPDDPKILFIKEKMLYVLGKRGEALKILQFLEETCKEDKGFLFLVYVQMIYTYHLLDEREKELATCEKLVSLAKEIGDDEKLGAAYCNMGNYYRDRDIDRASEYYNRSISLLKDSELLGEVYGDMYRIKEKRGNYSEAEEYLKKSIEIFAKANNLRNESACRANLGFLYMKLDRLSEALNILQDAYHTASRLHDLDGEAVISGNIGEVYMKRGLFPKAMEHFRHAYQVASQINHPRVQAFWLKKISEVYNKMGNSKKCEFYMKESSKIREKILAAEKENNNQTVPVNAESNDQVDISTRDD